MIGRLLDQRYKVVEMLGQGGFGHTYLAKDTRRPGNPNCVVKQLKPAIGDPDFLKIARRLFNNEAETLEKLGNNDQIPQLLAYFEEGEEFFLVEEFIDGHPLSKELTTGTKLSESQVIEILGDILSILEFVHSNNVIHRDIKPDNLIRRSSDNKLVLVDFGAVKQIKIHSFITQENLNQETVAIGTPGYMPSEQGQGRPRTSSDIYAVGMIGLQALTGVYPTQLPEDPETGEIIWRHLADANNQFAAFLNKMVRHYFKFRYQSATDALQEIRALSNPYRPKALVGKLQQKGHKYIKKVYVHGLSALGSFQGLTKTAYIPTHNTKTSVPTVLLSDLPIENPDVETTIAATFPDKRQNLEKTSLLNISFINKLTPKVSLLIGGSSGAIILTAALASQNYQPQNLSISKLENKTQIIADSQIKQAQIQLKKVIPNKIKRIQFQVNSNCLLVVKPSNLRSTSGRKRTGAVVKAGTKVTITGKTDGGWVEIISPEAGWIWQSRTKNTCQ